MPHVWDPENTKLSLLAGISTIAFAWRSFTVETAVPRQVMGTQLKHVTNHGRCGSAKTVLIWIAILIARNISTLGDIRPRRCIFRARREEAGLQARKRRRLATVERRRDCCNRCNEACEGRL